MVAYVNQMSGIAVEEPRVEDVKPIAPPIAPGPSRLRSTSKSTAKWVWHQLVNAISGPGLGEEYHGIDDSAMPMGFIAPYAKGSRQVRSLWHQPF